jgi:putative nucleotidyltransferase with HDIG domain
MLSPLGYLVAAAAYDEPGLVLAVAPLLWLLHVFSRERAERYAAAIELHQTYRGTVMVLSDVVEADDNYTASHCRSVVELAVATAEELGLDPRAQQELETAALLHDVGKIAIPKEILNKPAKLTDEEFELMKSHTVEGQALLDRVGGRLARVGEIVRSCHERWDGAGYPDGLRGEEIPLAARIVFCCDAYSAMTTDRPYRAAIEPAVALAELRANSGGQFEPRVVEAVCTVVTRDLETDAQPYADAVRAVLASNAPLPASRVETA